MPTIKDIAKAAGVSPASVSRVINNGPKVGKATRERIQKIIQELGYSPDANAQAINALSSCSVGIVLTSLIDPFFASMAQGIERVAAKKEAQIFMNLSDYSEASERRAIETLLEHRYQSIVVSSHFVRDEELVSYSKNAPGLVVINRYIEEIADRCVWLNDHLGGEIMARYLVSKGHRDIVIINADGGFSQSSLRIPGAIEALTDMGIEIDEDAIETANATYEGGQIAVQNLLASGKPFSAIIAFNDPMAIGAIAMLTSQGIKVPEDVSVIGYDNLMLASCIEPKLTTINHPIEEMAILATEMALSKNQNTVPEDERRFQPYLVERQSVDHLTPL